MPTPAQFSDDCPETGTRFQHWAFQGHVTEEHLDGPGRRLIEIGAVARVVHSTVLAGNDAPHDELPTGPAIPIDASTRAASASRAARHAGTQSRCNQVRPSPLPRPTGSRLSFGLSVAPQMTQPLSTFEDTGC